MTEADEDIVKRANHLVLNESQADNMFPGAYQNNTSNGTLTENNANESDQQQKVTPWDVQGAVVDGRATAIDYNRLVAEFGTRKITQELLERFERVTGVKPHPLLRRGLFFSHREFDTILTRFENNKPFYLYTGRGPSSASMHLGHLIPFFFCKWLQDVFDVPIVIQLTDDEKFLFKQSLTIEKAIEFSRENAKDIIACGFDVEKTLIFSDLNFISGPFYHNVVRISKMITVNQSSHTFGFNDSSSVGKLHFVSVQAAPALCSSFPQIFGSRKDIPCLIPCAIDQDPYFRITRDVTQRLKIPRPTLLHSKFFPALQGSQTKMSASVDNSAIFVSDTAAQIRNKIKRYAFSGGGATAEEHQRKGGNPDVDVAFQYLQVFEEDDSKIERLEREYRAGTLSTSQMKEECILKLQEVLGNFQKQRAAITPELLDRFMDGKRSIKCPACT